MTRFVLALLAPGVVPLQVTNDKCKWSFFTSKGSLNDQKTYIDIVVATYVVDFSGTRKGQVVQVPETSEAFF